MSEESGPRRLEEYIKVEYWGCNVLGHRHRTERSAAACMSRRKGESGDLKKLKRNISMLKAIMRGDSLARVSKTHYCSDSNVIKAVNSSLTKAWRYAKENGGNPYKDREWRQADLINPEYQKELDFLIQILMEQEVKLEKLVAS